MRRLLRSRYTWQRGVPRSTVPGAPGGGAARLADDGMLAVKHAVMVLFVDVLQVPAAAPASAACMHCTQQAVQVLHGSEHSTAVVDAGVQCVGSCCLMCPAGWLQCAVGVPCQQAVMKQLTKQAYDETVWAAYS